MKNVIILNGAPGIPTRATTFAGLPAAATWSLTQVMVCPGAAAARSIW